MAGKRRFGRIRRLPSGRWQARYKGPDGIDRAAPSTFATKRDAEVWLAKTEVAILSDQWMDPDAGAVPFDEYAQSWIDERPGLRPKTLELYRYLLRSQLDPVFTAWPVRDIREPHVRRWHKDRWDAGASSITVAKAYRLLRAVMNTAVDDGLIPRNPCRIKGGGQEKSPERPVLTIAQVFSLADTITPRYRGLVLLAVFTGLRWGELAALRRCDIDLDGQVVRVMRQLSEVRGRAPAFAAPNDLVRDRTSGP
jgi:integrase